MAGHLDRSLQVAGTASSLCTGSPSMGGRGISAWHLDEMAIAVCLYPTLRGVQLPTPFKCFGCSSCLSAWLTGWKVRGQAHSIHYQPHWGHSPLALPPGSSTRLPGRDTDHHWISSPLPLPAGVPGRDRAPVPPHQRAARGGGHALSERRSSAVQLKKGGIMLHCLRSAAACALAL